MKTSVVVEGLAEFRKALRSTSPAAAREVTKALKEAGKPILARAQARAPRRSGKLAGSGKIRARATSGFIVFSAPHAAGAEYGTRGKWSGFRKYGPRGNRYVFPALEEGSAEAFDVMTEQLSDIITVFGWFR